MIFDSKIPGFEGKKVEIITTSTTHPSGIKQAEKMHQAGWIQGTLTPWTSQHFRFLDPKVHQSYKEKFGGK